MKAFGWNIQHVAHPIAASLPFATTNFCMSFRRLTITSMHCTVKASIHRHTYTSILEADYNSWGEAMLNPRLCEFNGLDQRMK